MKKNALVFGCGSKFGLSLATELENCGFLVYGVSGSIETERVLKIDWDTCFINDFEKFLRNLPKIDLVIFNQNSHALTDNYWQLNSVPIFNIWKQSKQWKQSFYVNCILPTHVLHTLASADNLDNKSQILFMLSASMFNQKPGPLDYYGQKYQNYINMKKFAKKNTQTFIGVCPGHLDSVVYQLRAQKLINFVTQQNYNSGQFFMFDKSKETFNLNEEIQS
jgi:hypothetical protein